MIRHFLIKEKIKKYRIAWILKDLEESIFSKIEKYLRPKTKFVRGVGVAFEERDVPNISNELGLYIRLSKLEAIKEIDLILVMSQIEQRDLTNIIRCLTRNKGDIVETIIEYQNAQP